MESGTSPEPWSSFESKGQELLQDQKNQQRVPCEQRQAGRLVSCPATSQDSVLVLTASDGFLRTPCARGHASCREVLLLSFQAGCLLLFFWPNCPGTQRLKSSLLKEINRLSAVYAARISFVSGLLCTCRAKLRGTLRSRTYQSSLSPPFPHCCPGGTALSPPVVSGCTLHPSAVWRFSYTWWEIWT